MIMLVYASSTPHKIVEIHLKTQVNSVSTYLWSTRLICVSRDFPLSKGSTRYRDARTIAVTPLEGGAPEWLMDVHTRAHTPPARSRSVHDLMNKRKNVNCYRELTGGRRRKISRKPVFCRLQLYNIQFMYYMLAVPSPLAPPLKR